MKAEEKIDEQQKLIVSLEVKNRLLKESYRRSQRQVLKAKEKNDAQQKQNVALKQRLVAAYGEIDKLKKRERIRFDSMCNEWDDFPFSLSSRPNAVAREWWPSPMGYGYRTVTGDWWLILLLQKVVAFLDGLSNIFVQEDSYLKLYRFPKLIFLYIVSAPHFRCVDFCLHARRFLLGDGVVSFFQTYSDIQTSTTTSTSSSRVTKFSSLTFTLREASRIVWSLVLLHSLSVKCVSSQ